MTIAQNTDHAACPRSEAGPRRPPIVLFAIAVGTIVINLFASQTLAGIICPSLGMNEKLSGLVSTATLLGYAAGLFLLVPLADIAENRALVLRMLCCAALAAVASALAPTAWALLIALFLLGATCSAIQILVPLVAAMTPPEERGRVIGDVMGGLMFGIVLSRPIASLIAGQFGWRAFFGISGVTLLVLVGILAAQLPQRRPTSQAGYISLIASLGSLLLQERALRQRALTAGLVMGAFSLFWTTVALRLTISPFGLSQQGIAIFALIGAAGAAVTPFFGRAGDRGRTRPATIAAHLILLAGLAIAAWAGSAGAGSGVLPLAGMALSAVMLDIGVTGDQTLGRRIINLLQPEARGRLNALFVGLFFIGGAVGSAMAGYAWSAGGWTGVCLAAAGFGLAAFLSHLFSRRTYVF